MNTYQASLEALTANVKDTYRKLKRDGVTGMSKRNLRQVTSTRGVTVPAGVFDRLFDEAIEAAKLPEGFIYE